MKKEFNQTAWELLCKTELTVGEKIAIRNHFVNTYKDEYPFVSIKCEKDKIKYYFSDIKDIKTLIFETEKEVILANAIYENVKDKFDINEFIQMLKFTFRMLNISSNWNK